jgi:hypothetical protein
VSDIEPIEITSVASPAADRTPGLAAECRLTGSTLTVGDRRGSTVRFAFTPAR